MTDVVVTDPDFAAKFQRAAAPLTVRGPDGRELGVFTPVLPTAMTFDFGVSEDELRRLEDASTGKWYTADEVMAKIQEWKCTP